MTLLHCCWCTIVLADFFPRILTGFLSGVFLKSCQETEKLPGKTVNLGQISFSAWNFGISRQEILGKMSPAKTIWNRLKIMSDGRTKYEIQNKKPRYFVLVSFVMVTDLNYKIKKSVFPDTPRHPMTEKCSQSSATKSPDRIDFHHYYTSYHF